MLQIIKYKWFYLIFSAILLVPGIISLIVFGLRLSIDFTGGSLFKFAFNEVPPVEQVEEVFKAKNIEVESIVRGGNNELIIRSKPVDTAINNELRYDIDSRFTGARQLSFETVGPSIGMETAKNAFIALAWAMAGILLYIAYAFRNVPKPYSGYRFGVSAILAMLHDAVIVVGLFSIFGYFFGIEVDALFITALLTVIGFSVHDTIVVFDRIRENLGKLARTHTFSDVVNYSIVETLSRSLATSLTVIITLTALYVLGGESIKNFVLAMLIGIISGTYSSIFTASPILVIWEEHIAARKRK